MARRGRRSGGGRVIDYKQWVGMPALATSTGVAATLLGSSIGFTAPATILRCRGEVLVALFDGADDDSAPFITVALGIVSSDAYAAGAGSVPDPAAEPEYPWLFWYCAPLAAIENSTTGAVEEGSDIARARRIVVDTKAMRRVKPGETLAWVFQTSGAYATQLISQGITRVLVGT